MSSGKVCPNCGNEVREGARFCASCGAQQAPTDPQLSPDEPPPPVASPTSKRRLRWVAVGAAVALLLAGGAAAAVLTLTGDDEPSQAEVDSVVDELYSDTTEPDLFGDTEETTDIYGDTTDTTDASGDIGQGVDETCEDLVAFFLLARDTDIARGGNSVDDIEELAAAASELASKAPAEPETGDILLGDGEPRDSLEGIAEAYETYLSVLSEGDLEPGPDALLEPRVADAFSDVSLEVTLGIVPWMDARCDPELLEGLGDLGNG